MANVIQPTTGQKIVILCYKRVGKPPIQLATLWLAVCRVLILFLHNGK